MGRERRLERDQREGGRVGGERGKVRKRNREGEGREGR